MTESFLSARGATPLPPYVVPSSVLPPKLYLDGKSYGYGFKDDYREACGRLLEGGPDLSRTKPPRWSTALFLISTQGLAAFGMWASLEKDSTQLTVRR